MTIQLYKKPALLPHNKCDGICPGKSTTEIGLNCAFMMNTQHQMDRNQLPVDK